MIPGSPAQQGLAPDHVAWGFGGAGGTTPTPPTPPVVVVPAVSATRPVGRVVAVAIASGLTTLVPQARGAPAQQAVASGVVSVRPVGSLPAVALVVVVKAPAGVILAVPMAKGLIQ